MAIRKIEERSPAAQPGGAARARIAGVWCPVLTPVDQDLKPDAVRFVAHARWLLDEGCHGLVVFGTTGEANSFSVEERIAFLEAILDAGLPRDRMLVGTGCCALSDTVRLTKHALSLGITGVLALPPFYYKNLSDEALFGSFDQVIQRVADTSFALYLYHFPSLSGVPITPGLLERLGAALSGHSRRRQGQLGRLEQHQAADRALSGARHLSRAPRPYSCRRCTRAAPGASARPATSTPARSASSMMTSAPAPTVSSSNRTSSTPYASSCSCGR